MSSSGEIELCYYCEIRKPEGLDQANAVEQHEQYEYRLPPAADGSRRGRIRVRRTDKNNETMYEEMIKLPMNASSTLGDMEVPVQITEAYFKAWQQVYRVPGQKKIRHTFVSSSCEMTYQGNLIKLPPTKFEVDIFISSAGKKSVWAKVDIEVQDIVNLLKESYEDVDAAKFEINFSALPLDIGQVIAANTKHADEIAAIENFYKVYAIPCKAE